MCCNTFIRPTPLSTIPPSSFATQQNEDDFEDDEFEDDEFEDDEFEDNRVSLVFIFMLLLFGNTWRRSLTITP